MVQRNQSFWNMTLCR